MNDVKTPRTAARAMWALPLVALAPLATIGILTEEPSPGWTVVSWVLWALSAVLVAAEWAVVIRRGTREPAQWAMCVLVHAVLAWQLIALLQQ
ncbi:hypothetical protein ACWGNF_20540 [Streptomyces sp. NPDC055808]|uniref:hypothetical protein n=1 Tax=Streptomyces sp. NPDC001828 TaxID=3364615 RepID=UPI0036BFBC6A